MSDSDALDLAEKRGDTNIDRVLDHEEATAFLRQIDKNQKADDYASLSAYCDKLVTVLNDLVIENMRLKALVEEYQSGLADLVVAAPTPKRKKKKAT